MPSRRPSGHYHHHPHNASTAPPPDPPTHQRTFTEPALLRLPSTSSSTRSRRATNPSTPTAPTPSQPSTATSPSYFSPQHPPPGKDARSPPARRPNGIDTSRGPPITAVTRGFVDIGRRLSQSSADYAFAQQQLLSSGLVSPGGASRSGAGDHRRLKPGPDQVAHHTPQLQPPHSQTQTQTTALSRQNSTTTPRRPRYMASSVDDSSEYASSRRSQSEDARGMGGRRGATDASGTDGEQPEDLFLHIAEDNAARESIAEAASRTDRLKSRIARASTRQSFPSALHSPSPAPPSSVTSTANARRLPSAIDTKTSTPARRNSLIPSSSRLQRDQLPLTPNHALETPRSRLLDQSPKAPLPSPSPRIRDQDLSPRQFLSQLGRRRPSYPDAAQTPPSRSQTYRPSNLNYSSSRDNQDAPQPNLAQKTPSRADGTESLDDSTGPAASVWDELDDLKSRIRRIELGGKIPTTSGAVVANATADRPRTANTSITTVSSSPKQQRKTNMSPTDSMAATPTAQKAHPVLREALAKAKQYVSPAVYRVLEATASEAISLAEIAGSAGPQGTLHSASSILNGVAVPDRQVRRKADNLCRSLTDLCVELCDNKSSVASPALRNIASSTSRRPSVQINGESPQIRQSIEPESDTIPRSSPSRAMDRIQARRTSMMAVGAGGAARESSQDPPTPSQLHIPSRLSRAGTSLNRTRQMGDEDDEDPTLRAPSRALTDFRDIRISNTPSRFTREYTSREPMPELQPSPALPQTTSLRRPTVTGVGNENHLLFRANNQRYSLNRQSAPAYEKAPTDLGPRAPFSSNRNSIGGTSGLGRTVSLSRRFRGNGAGE